MSMTALYAFRPLSRSDLPLVARWLAAPHVVAWWAKKDKLVDTREGRTILMVRSA
jgi:hypothetical protein